MTEAEWLAATDPRPMLEFQRSRVTDRKLRLFAIACCRTAWALIPEGLHRESLWLAERHADEQATDAELGVAVSALHRVRRKRNRIDVAVYEAVRYRREQSFGNAESVADAIARAIATAAAPDPSPTAMSYFRGDELVTESIPPNADRLRWDATFADHQRVQTDILRDIFTNPFRPVTADPKWLTSTVVGLAQAVYDGRAFDLMPIVADALEEAGCDNTDVLSHCRQPGEHVRGCWVVDMLTGRE